MFVSFISKFNRIGPLKRGNFITISDKKSTLDRLDKGFTQVSLKTKSIIY